MAKRRRPSSRGGRRASVRACGSAAGRFQKGGGRARGAGREAIFLGLGFGRALRGSALAASPQPGAEARCLAPAGEGAEPAAELCAGLLAGGCLRWAAKEGCLGSLTIPPALPFPSRREVSGEGMGAESQTGSPVTACSSCCPSLGFPRFSSPPFLSLS